MKVKVWLDDVRRAPAGWVHVRDADSVLELLSAGLVEEMSLDHDLGEEYHDGTYLVNAIEKGVMTGSFALPLWRVHSANAVARDRMVSVLSRLSERAPEPEPALPTRHEWVPLGQILAVIRKAAAGEWSWSANSRCKYIDVRIDMRDGGCILRDRAGCNITLAELAHQAGKE